MKKKGCQTDYIAARNADLREAWRRQFCASNTSKRQSEIMRSTVESPAAKFWVSEGEALRVVKRMLMHGGQYKSVSSRRALYAELHRRVVELHGERGGDVTDIILEVLHQPAPQFYLTPQSAYTILRRSK